VTGKIAGDRFPAGKVLEATEEAGQPDGLTTSRPRECRDPENKTRPKSASAPQRPPAGENCPSGDRKSRPNSPAVPPPSSTKLDTATKEPQEKGKRNGEEREKESR